MSMDATKVFYTKIGKVISESEVIGLYLSEIYPDFSKKFFAQVYSLEELRLIHATVHNFTSSTFQNLLIAIRLNGGSSELANKLSVDPKFITDILANTSKESVDSLCSQIQEANLVSGSFFQKKRQFYTESIIARFRRSNLTKILATATDFQAVVNILSNELSPSEKVLIDIQEGRVNGRSSWACRKIETKLKLPNGTLDKKF
ncbi:hypothetical protein [Vibrio sp. R78045]|uniref:hypothetical protein n=1 Tax=Vibrio sp. R78045 TaxID=3093868 RepID=UPI0036F414E5